MTRWESLPRATDEDTESTFPMLFYGIVGDDQHEVDSPSFWNPHEAAKVRRGAMHSGVRCAGVGLAHRHRVLRPPLDARSSRSFTL